MASNVTERSWNKPKAWDGYHYTRQSRIPSIPAPSGFTAVASGASIVLSWTDETGGTGKTLIQRSPNGADGWQSLVVKGEGIQTHTDTPTTGGTYYYRAYSVIGTVSSPSPSSVVSATVVTTVPAPTSLTATPSGTTVTVAWTDNTAGAATVRIERSSTSASAGFTTLTTVAAGVTSYANTGLSAGTYWYRAIAILAGDESTASNVDDAVVASGTSPLYTTNLAVDTTGLPYFQVNRYARTTQNPPPGKTHSLRMNLQTNRTDPLEPTILGSSIYTANFTHGINTKDYASVTYLMRFRFDDAQWFNSDSVSGFGTHDMNAKLCYIAHSGYSSQLGFYLSSNQMGGTNGSLNWGDNMLSGAVWDNWEQRTYGWRGSNGSPSYVAYGGTGTDWGADGQWHILKVQFVFNYTDSLGTYTRARALIDDVPVTGSAANFTTDGWTRLPPEFTPAVMRTVYSEGASTGPATDRTGYACGLQIGDCELWQGLI